MHAVAIIYVTNGLQVARYATRRLGGAPHKLELFASTRPVFLSYGGSALSRRMIAALRVAFLCTGASALSVQLTPDLAAADHGVRIAASPGKGMGAFATRVFEQWEVIGDYTGELITHAQHEARYAGGDMTADDLAWLESRQARGVSANGDYVLRIHDDLYVDAEDPAVSSWCRFINHDARPNLAMKVLPKGIGGAPRVWFVAMRDVAEGEELSYDYGPEFWREEDGVDVGWAKN
jgi:hypothetical protein